MADDGILLNFAPALPGVWNAKPVFKGGNWKDRMTAKKTAARGAEKRRQSDPAPDDGRKIDGESRAHPSSIGPRSQVPQPDNRPIKRRRTDDSERRTPGSGGQGERDLIRAAQSQIRQGKSGPKEVVSSLFTYNPAAATKKLDITEADEGEDDAAAVEASNAPLSPEMENFTTLGLSRTLAHHLLNKMAIKAPTAIQRKAVAQLLQDDSDAFVQAETGSGKTLAYLLPLVQRLVQLSEKLKAHERGARMGRESGLFAIVLAPTRELSKQISTVLDALLGAARYIVAGTVIGGEKKKSEKARLRKGLNILVATPGRLADHLSNTEALDISRVRWLVLDEGDRLMELGFGEDIQKIISALNLRMRATGNQDDGVVELLPKKRTTVLCSATIKMDVQKLGEISLKDAAHIASDKKEEKTGEATDAETAFQAPSQLKQSYAVVPAKQRLVSLVALLRRTFARKGSTMKAIVFLSCADSVDFHFELLTRQEKSSDAAPASTEPSSVDAPKLATTRGKIPQGTLLPETRTSGEAPCISHPSNPVTVHRLHGSLPQAVRTSSLLAFSRSSTASVLVCTDVASRGLDLPNIDLVVEYDPAFARDDHLHRIGRTARAGRDGRALVFLMPGCEEGYVDVLRQGRRTGSSVARHDAEELLRKGFAPTSGVISGGREWEDRATAFQLDIERWALDDSRILEAARRAFQSHVRAYATHVAAERGMFDIKQLHLGHLCKAFGLRDRPGSIKVPGLRQGRDEVKKARAAGAGGRGTRDDDDDAAAANDVADAKRKMRERMKAMGGASEFNLG
ncbi:DEAD-domain-containing protein [Myriangium duriaei CBS 260.36]|uniref:ATP-dependent RNA helicase n=1 Tax=Myriangium duriaei CBS 260.36 TaxID=1168546 RepID=A0A9P4J3H4_9PEZI|nr:DEAD-domain-containing protein [Myriangium duriaei CBS 260.36]